MIFVTVGTQFPFDRLVKAVDDAVGNGFANSQIYAQIAGSSYQARNFGYIDFLEKELFDDYVRKASGIISHAGMGIITLALDNNKPLLVMPRLKQHGEVVNNHQLIIAKKFEQPGHILVAYDVEELPEKIEQLKTFVPCKREAQPQAVIERITQFLTEMSADS